MTYKNYYNYLLENQGAEGEDWVRPGSDLEPGMKIGSTNFPHGFGYPNYKPKHNDDKDFEESAYLTHIIDIPYQHNEQDNKKRTGVLYKYIKTKQPEFYNKFQSYIDRMFATYNNYTDIHSWFIGFINLAKKEPSHKNVPNEFKNIEVTQQDLETAIKINDVYSQLYQLIHHRDDPQNELNYPLNVSLYDITRAFGGYEEGGWYYDKFELVESIEIHNPNQLLPTAEKLYGHISRALDGKPYICIEKEKGSQEKRAPSYS